MSKTDLVGKLIEKYFCVIEDGKSLSTGNEPVLPEDAADFFLKSTSKYLTSILPGSISENTSLMRVFVFYPIHGFLITLKLTTMHRKY